MRAPVLCSLAAALALLPGLAAGASETFGAGVTLPEATPLADVLERPADFEGRTVRVEGVVSAVCTHMGCWMALAPGGASPGRTVLVKVDDGVIVFPVSAKGRRAAAQGVVERVGGDAESQSAAAEHAAHGAAAGSRPVAWQIKATGAVVY